MASESQLRQQQIGSVEAIKRASGLQERQAMISQQSKQEEQIKTLQDKVTKTISEINEGKISDYEQIPTDIRQYLNIDRSYFQQRKAIQESQKQYVKDSQFNLAVRVYLGQVSGGTQAFKDIPSDIKNKAKEFAESKERQAFRSVEFQVISQAESISQQTLSPVERQAILKSVKIDKNQISFTPSGNMSYARPEDLQQMSVIPMSYNEVSYSSTPQMSVPIKEKKGFLDVFGSVAKKIADFPIIKKTPLASVSRKFEYISLTSESKRARKNIDQLSYMTSKGYEDLYSKAKISTGDVQINRDLPFVGYKEKIPSLGKITKDVLSSSPELLFFIPSTGSDVILSSRSLAPEERQAEREKKITEIDYLQRQQTLSPEYRFATREEVSEEVSGTLDSSIKKQNVMKLVFGLGALGTVGLIKGGQKLFEPIVRREGGQIVEPLKGFMGKGYTFSQPIRTTEGTKTIVGGTINVEREEVKEFTTNRLKKFFNIDESVRVVSPKRTYTTEVYGEKDGLLFVEKYKTGKAGIPGKSKFEFAVAKDSTLPVQDIQKGGNIPDYLLEEISFLKTGYRSPKEMIPKLFTEEEMLVLGKQGLIKLVSKGSQMEFIGTVSRLTPTRKLSTGTKVYTFDTVSKDITSKYPRRMGAKAITGTYLEFPTIGKSGIDVKVITGGGKKTPFSKTFGSEQTTSNVLSLPIPSVPKPNLKVTQVVSTSKPPTLSAVIQETKTTQDSFYGTGQYERTTGGIVPGQKDLLGFDIQQKEKQDFFSDTSLKINTKPKLETTSITILKTNQKQDLGLKSPSKLRESLLEVVKQREELLLKQPLKEQQQTKQIQTLTPKIPSQTTRVNPPKIKTPKIPFTLDSSNTPDISLRRADKIFTAFGKRFGKEIELGKTKTKKGAEDILGKFLKTTLGASGKIKEGEKTLKAEQLSFLKERGFRKSKRNQFDIVEVKEMRLKKGTGEIPEIQTFKKRAKRIFKL